MCRADCTRCLHSPLGWSSWNPYHAGVIGLDEKTIRAQADAMVSSGMAAAGCEHVSIRASACRSAALPSVMR